MCLCRPGSCAAAAAPPPPRAQSAPLLFSCCSVLGRAPATSAPVGNLPRLTCPGTLMHIFLVLRPRRSTSLATQARELCLCHFRRLHTSCVKMLGLRANCTPPPPLRPTQVEGCSGRPGPVGKNAGGLNSLGPSRQPKSRRVFTTHKKYAHFMGTASTALLSKLVSAPPRKSAGAVRGAC